MEKPMLNTLTRYEPLTGHLDRVLDELFRPAAWQAPASQLPRMRVDVRDDGDAYTVFAELPGVKKDEISVEVDGDEVAISAETRREDAKEAASWLYAERRFGRLRRSIVVPQEIDAAGARARFDSGVLELTLPKKAAPATRRVEVR
jgi:HSP20 family protein